MTEPTLPSGWVEQYYDTSTTEDGLTSVTALYEHTERLVKIAVVPESPRDGSTNRFIPHETYLIHPVSEDVGLPTYFTDVTSTIEEYLISVIPSISSRGRFDERHAGPYNRLASNGEAKFAPQLRRYPEPSFDWSLLPTEAVESLQTKGERVRDETLVEHEESIMQLARLWEACSDGLIENPHPVSLSVAADDEGYYIVGNPQLSSNEADEVGTYLQLTVDETAPIDDGDAIGTAYFDFHEGSFPTLNTITLTERGEALARPRFERIKDSVVGFFG